MSDANSPQPLIDKNEAARLLDCSTRTLERYRLRSVDPLPYIQLSKRRVRYQRASLEAWIARRTVGEVA